jgi:hypothetical protein
MTYIFYDSKDLAETFNELQELSRTVDSLLRGTHNTPLCYELMKVQDYLQTRLTIVHRASQKAQSKKGASR